MSPSRHGSSVFPTTDSLQGVGWSLNPTNESKSSSGQVSLNRARLFGQSSNCPKRAHSPRAVESESLRKPKPFSAEYSSSSTAPSALLPARCSAELSETRPAAPGGRIGEPQEAEALLRRVPERTARAVRIVAGTVMHHGVGDLWLAEGQAIEVARAERERSDEIGRRILG